SERRIPTGCSARQLRATGNTSLFLTYLPDNSTPLSISQLYEDYHDSGLVFVTYQFEPSPAGTLKARQSQPNTLPNLAYSVPSPGPSGTIAVRLAPGPLALATSPSIRPYRSLTVRRPLRAERTTVKPLSTPRRTAIRECSQPSRLKSHAGTSRALTPWAA